MKKNYTLICSIQDRSGSMSSIRKDTIEGYNTFIEEQKKVPGEASATLIQFDDKYEVVYKNKNLKNVPPLTYETFVPRGSTALLDSVAKGIIDTGKELAETRESERPEKVIFIIQSDGEENSSREYTYEKVAEMINHQRNKYNWEFLFLGTNLDSIKEATKMGINTNKAMTYANNSVGTHAVYCASSNLVSSLRRCANADMDKIGFSDEDREKQKELLNQP